MAFEHFSAETQANYGQAKEPLKARFEPPSQKELIVKGMSHAETMVAEAMLFVTVGMHRWAKYRF